jgi:hypothetical protein
VNPLSRISVILMASMVQASLSNGAIGLLETAYLFLSGEQSELSSSLPDQLYLNGR